MPTVRRCPFAKLGAFPDLFVDYCTDFDAVGDYYAGDWRDDTARREAADVAAKRPADRAMLADVLAEQNTAWGAGSPTLKNVERLRDPDSIAVVTGQQAGLFTGPLYTIYKTITTLQHAQELAHETGRPVVPVFWVAGEDHDLPEIASTHLLRRNELATLTYDGHTLPTDGNLTDRNLGAVGRLRLTDRIADVVDALDGLLPDSDFKPAIMERVRSAYRPGERISDAFVRLMLSLFEDDGLVFVRSDDPRLKALAAPLFRRDLNDPATPIRRIQAASEALEADGYHAQVHARATNLFWLTDDARTPIDHVENDRFALRGTDRTLSRDELLQALDDTPERFSPNVVLRPLMQDRLLPTAAYVAGPGETSYFAQYKGVYDWAEIPMPLIHPRASVTLVESKVQKVLDKFDLSICAFGSDLDRLFQDVVVQEMEVDVDAVFQDALRHVHQAVNTLKPEVESVDRTLVQSAEATRAALMESMNDFKHKVVRAEKRQHEDIRAQLQKAHVNLRPNGLQERTVNVLYFLNKYDLSLLDRLKDALSSEASAHQVVSV